ncbi:MAG: 6-carboxytetrahydropterin synthase [Candidatus Krumholzibacteria bacterium]|nr:6-carboxytetrahydropterin synthase [Candidatus Krumholzibacteria bacterium]
MVYLTFVCAFNAIHRLWNTELSAEDNIETYGECANGHGHLFRIEITVARDITGENPVVVERRAIRDIVDSVLAPKLRHGNMDTAFSIDNFVSTGENVTRAIWQLIKCELPKDVALVAVKVIETPKNSFVYCGENVPQRASVPIL